MAHDGPRSGLVGPEAVVPQSLPGAPRVPRIPRTIADLEAGDHLCCIYETEAEHRAILTPFLRQGLERGEKVIYIVDARTAETILGYLRDDGLDPDPFVARGQLAILSRDETYLRGGAFYPAGMIALQRKETERALADGYAALRLTGEMTWALRGHHGSERLIQYAILLNEFFPGRRCLALCQFDRRRFEPGVLLHVLRTHPYVIVGTDVCENPHYLPPADMLSADSSAAELRRWMQGLTERRRADEALQRERDRAQRYLDIAGIVLVGIAADQTITLANRKACELLGRPPEELLGRNWFDTALPEREREEIRALFVKLVGGELEPVDLVVNRLVTRSGEERIVRWHNTLERDASGHIAGTLSSGEDVTEHNRLEEALRASEARHRHVVE